MTVIELIKALPAETLGELTPIMYKLWLLRNARESFALRGGGGLDALVASIRDDSLREEVENCLAASQDRRASLTSFMATRQQELEDSLAGALRGMIRRHHGREVSDQEIEPYVDLLRNHRPVP